MAAEGGFGRDRDERGGREPRQQRALIAEDNPCQGDRRDEENPRDGSDGPVRVLDDRVDVGRGIGTPVTERPVWAAQTRSEEHTSELQSQSNLVCRLLLEKK